MFMMGMSTFVLVHGFWHDGAAWSRVINRLEQRGHSAFGPTIAGFGRGVCKRVSHAESTQSIVEFIVARGLTDIVLVGHSTGGTIISKVVELIPDRVRRLVFHSGFVLNDGESLNDAVPPHFRALFAELAKAAPDNTVMLPFMIWREMFINDADLRLAWSSYKQLSPGPYQQIVEPLDLEKFYALDTPRSYLIGRNDIALPPGEWGWHPRMSDRLGQYRLVQMPGSHELIFSNPSGLADKIIEAGCD
jgi:pimeloyl-ACP methyl ester carboxylesterase